MTKLFDHLYHPKTLLIFIGLCAAGFILTLWNRFIYIDDAWFGEQAYWFAQHGIPKTETIKDYFKWDEHLLVYHKLNIILGALIVKIFGWSVNYFRVFTLLTFLIFIWIFTRYLRSNQQKYGKKQIIVAIFFLFVNPLIIMLGYTYRPEILVMAFGFLSWIFLQKGLQVKYFGNNLFIGGLFAGLAFFTHLNGLIFPIAGGILLMCHRNLKQLVYFGMGAIVTSLLFFYDLWQPGRLELFFFQLKNWPDPVGSNYLPSNALDVVRSVLIKLSQEHQRFFWSEKVWILSVSFFLSLIVFFRTFRKRHKDLLIYTAALILSLNIFGSHIAERYIIYYLPFMAMIIAIGLSEIEIGKMTWVRTIFVVLLVAQLFFCGKMIGKIMGKNRDYVAMHDNILSNIPNSKALTFVDYPFVFNGLVNYNLISYKAFEYYEVSENIKFDKTSLLLRAQQLGVKYILITTEKHLVENTYLFELFDDKSRDFTPYKLIYESEGYLILESLTDNSL
ncbi:MAG: hypothetical protein Q8M23_05415 [Bacteroidales bacterium]|nr:hypothetical protein [Bacteroidales bacterium]